MRRDTWLGLGIAGVACLLMCAGAQSGGMEDDAASEDSSAPAASQQPATTQAPPTQAPASSQPQPGTGGSGTGTQAPDGTAPSAAPQQDTGTPAQPSGSGGSGGSGDAPASDPNSPSAEPNPEARTTPPNPGTDPNAGTGGTGNTGTGNTGTRAPPATTPSGSSAAQQGVAVVDAIYRGTVRSVSPKEVVIDNEGLRLPLEIGTQTRIVRDGENIGVTELKEGERVRATVNIVGRSHTREIAVLTGSEARRDAETRRR
ncbi:hypothetical protein JYK02_21255 [Corallococcus macrosporus]|uniref:DUF5666 domain-containing protein n=1 Tax=Corallococcus macrosporus TaxID=35 RepID=A0ABS3DEI3_9BACT|nr:hypothetical protein [Corallococcus macrosporus]MBN8230046.1 hypothetical protein [Corallococcus macrosporus]